MKNGQWLLSVGTEALLIMGMSLCHLCYAAMLRGSVVDSADNGSPVPGVLVSVGYGLHRTVTDSAGRFSLEVPEIGVLPRKQLHGPSRRTIKWDLRQRSIDLTDAPEITTVSIYRLNGARVWGGGCFGMKRVITIPVTAPGIYLINFVRHDKSSFVWKVMHAGDWGVRTITAASSVERKSAVEASGNGIPLIFRHDDYYPIDRQLDVTDDSLMIRMVRDPRSFVFDRAAIRTCSFTLTRDDSLLMERSALKEEFVPAEFSYNGTSFGKVGLRYKGSTTGLATCFDTAGNRNIFNPACRSVSMKVKFDEYVDTTRFYRMKRLNLHSMSRDDSKLREALSYALFRESGIYTSRTAFVKVVVNGVFRGLFTAVEEIDGRFTKSRWPLYGDGNLYKEAWPAGTDETVYRAALVTNDKPEDSAVVSRMVDFYDAIKGSTPEAFGSRIAPFMDPDYWLRYIAVDRAIHNIDGIMSWYASATPGVSFLVHQNFYFYEEEAPGGKIWLIPWDLHGSLYEKDYYVDDQGVPEWNEAPDNCDPVAIMDGLIALVPPHCDKLTELTADALWNGFVALGEQFLTALFTPDRMKKRIDQLSALIEPVMTDEPSIGRDDWRTEIDDLKSAMDSLYVDFDDHLYGRPPAEDTAGSFVPFPADSGFLAGRVNNFEFSPEMPIAAWVHAFISDSSSILLMLDTVSPLRGTADLHCLFVFRPSDAANQNPKWASVRFNFNDAANCSGLEEVRMNLQCDVPRTVRIEPTSEIYGRHNVNVGYGWSTSVGTKCKQFVFRTNMLAYPMWAPGSPDLLDSVLTTMTGIAVNPSPRFGNAVPDSGWVRIDNIKFVFASDGLSKVIAVPTRQSGNMARGLTKRGSCMSLMKMPE